MLAAGSVESPAGDVIVVAKHKRTRRGGKKHKKHRSGVAGGQQNDAQQESKQSTGVGLGLTDFIVLELDRHRRDENAAEEAALLKRKKDKSKPAKRGLAELVGSCSDCLRGNEKEAPEDCRNNHNKLKQRNGSRGEGQQQQSLQPSRAGCLNFSPPMEGFRWRGKRLVKKRNRITKLKSKILKLRNYQKNVEAEINRDFETFMDEEWGEKRPVVEERGDKDVSLNEAADSARNQNETANYDSLTTVRDYCAFTENVPIDRAIDSAQRLYIYQVSVNGIFQKRAKLSNVI